jgi:hypothetical protein
MRPGHPRSLSLLRCRHEGWLCASGLSPVPSFAALESLAIRRRRYSLSLFGCLRGYDRGLWRHSATLSLKRVPYELVAGLLKHDPRPLGMRGSCEQASASRKRSENASIVPGNHGR